MAQGGLVETIIAIRNSLLLFLPIIQECSCKILFNLMHENIFFYKPLPELQVFSLMINHQLKLKKKNMVN